MGLWNASELCIAELPNMGDLEWEESAFHGRAGRSAPPHSRRRLSGHPIYLLECRQRRLFVFALRPAGSGTFGRRAYAGRVFRLRRSRTLSNWAEGIGDRKSTRLNSSH